MKKKKEKDESLVIDHKHLMDELEQQIELLKTTVSKMQKDRGISYIKWLKDHNNYLNWESTFNPKRNKAYKRKEVIHVQFGFNTGSEQGGPHWAVVLEDNAKSSPVVTVVPLGSLEDDEDESKVHRDDVFLGTIPSINDKRVYAMPRQIRTISKIRIIKPKKSFEPAHMLTDEQMDKIDVKLFEFYFEKSKKIEELVISSMQAAVGKSDN